jgi:hypothetical protein
VPGNTCFTILLPIETSAVKPPVIKQQLDWYVQSATAKKALF